MSLALTVSTPLFRGIGRAARFTNENRYINRFSLVGKSVRALTALGLTGGSVVVSSVATIETVSHTAAFVAMWTLNQIFECPIRYFSDNPYFEISPLVGVKNFFYYRMEDGFANTLFSFKTPLCYVGKAMSWFGDAPPSEGLAIVILTVSAVAFSCGLIVSCAKNIRDFYSRGIQLDYFFQKSARERINLTMGGRLEQPVYEPEFRFLGVQRPLLNQQNQNPWRERLLVDMFDNINRGIGTEREHSNRVLAGYVRDAVDLIKGQYREFVQEDDLRAFRLPAGNDIIARVAEILEIFKYVNSPDRELPPDQTRATKIQEARNFLRKLRDEGPEQDRVNLEQFKEIMIKLALGREPTREEGGALRGKKREISTKIFDLSDDIHRGYCIRSGLPGARPQDRSELQKAFASIEDIE